jgi:hypothetical protein
MFMYREQVVASFLHDIGVGQVRWTNFFVQRVQPGPVYPVVGDDRRRLVGRIRGHDILAFD